MTDSRITDELMKVSLKAICYSRMPHRDVKAALTAAYSLIRNAVLDEVAGMLLDEMNSNGHTLKEQRIVFRLVQAIRDMKEGV